jgi:diguanylate cyclase (GGDEF)-like protein
MERELIRKTSKITHLVIAICLFVFLDCFILGINLYLTHELERDALAINIAGRERMLTQRMAKVTYQLEAEPALAIEEQLKEELFEAHHLFTSTLDSFEKSGYVIDSEGSVQPFKKVTDELALQFVINTKELFTPWSEQIKALRDGQIIDYTKMRLLAEQTNLPMLEQVNLLTSRMEALSGQKTQMIRLIQGVALLLAFVNFVVIIRLFLSRSRQAQIQIDNFLDLLDNASTAMIVVDDDNRIVLANKMSQELFGYPAHLFLMTGIDNLIRKERGNSYGVRRDGSVFQIDLTMRPFLMQDKALTVITVLDISKHTSEQQRLAHLANHDTLTGLVNRRAFFDRLDMEILRTRRSGLLLGIYFLDLDRFKQINDTQGHGVGDELLKQVAKRLVGCVRETDTVARFAGDEFVIMVHDVHHKHEFEKVRAKLIELFASPFYLRDTEHNIGCSVGLSIYPLDGTDATKLIEKADERMYQDKQIAERGIH